MIYTVGEDEAQIVMGLRFVFINVFNDWMYAIKCWPRQVENPIKSERTNHGKLNFIFLGKLKVIENVIENIGKITCR